METKQLVAEVKELVPDSSVADESAFITSLSSNILHSSCEDKELAMQLIAGLESVLTNQMQFANLSIRICVKLCELTGKTPTKIIRAVEEAAVNLKLPSTSWLHKNVKAAQLVNQYPQLGEIKDVEKLNSLQALPKEALDTIIADDCVLVVDDEAVDLKEASRKEIRDAVKAAKVKKVERDAEVAEKTIMDSSEFIESEHKRLGAEAYPSREIEGASSQDAEQQEAYAEIDFEKIHTSALEDIQKLEAVTALLAYLPKKVSNKHSDYKHIVKNIDKARKSIELALGHWSRKEYGTVVEKTQDL